MPDDVASPPAAKIPRPAIPGMIMPAGIPPVPGMPGMPPLPAAMQAFVPASMPFGVTGF